MNIGKTLAITIMVISFLASAGYAWQGDIRHAIYWFAGGVLNASVTF